MNEATTKKVQLFGAWCGVAYCLLLLIGWWPVAGFYPLHEPSAGPGEISAFFRDNTMGVRIGLIIVMWGAAAFIPFAATIADFVSQAEGRQGPLTRMTGLAGFGNAMLTFYPPLWWLTASFRPDVRAEELTYLLNDIAWLQFVGGLSLIIPMFIGVAVAALSDRRPEAPFPRWFGFLTVWVAILFLPGQLLFFFKTGPFAWNGILALWLPVTVFVGWFVVIFFVMRKRILG